MVIQRFIEKCADGELQGLILLWNCTHCETGNATWLIRKEAASGEKHTFCSSCRGLYLVKFSSSDIMSSREEIVQRALPFIPSSELVQILERHAINEGLYLSEGRKKMADRHWKALLRDINYWVQQDQYKTRIQKEK